MARNVTSSGGSSGRRRGERGRPVARCRCHGGFGAALGREEQHPGQQQCRRHRRTRLREEGGAQQRGEHRSEHEAQLVRGLFEGVGGVPGGRVVAEEVRPAGAGHPAGVGRGGGGGVGGEEGPVGRAVADAQEERERAEDGERGGRDRDTGLAVAVDQPGGPRPDQRRRRQPGRGDRPGQRVGTTRPGDHQHRADAEHPHRQPGRQVGGREGAGAGDGEDPAVGREGTGAEAEAGTPRGRAYGPGRAYGRGRDRAGGEEEDHASTVAAAPAVGPTPGQHPFTHLCC